MKTVYKRYYLSGAILKDDAPFGFFDCEFCVPLLKRFDPTRVRGIIKRERNCSGAVIFTYKFMGFHVR